MTQRTPCLLRAALRLGQTRTFALSAFLLVIGVCDVQAQRCPDAPVAGGPDPTQIDLAVGVPLVRNYELPAISSEIIVLRTVSEERVDLIPVLEEIASNVCSGVVGYQAMYALRMLGQPHSYFLNLIAAHAGTGDRQDRDMVHDAIRTLAQDPDSTTFQAIESVVGAEPGMRVEDAVDDYATILMIQREIAADSLFGQVDELLGQMTLMLLDGWYNDDDGTVVFDTTGERGYLDPGAVWARGELRRLAAEQPAEVSAILDMLPEAPYFAWKYPDAVETVAQAFEAYARGAAFPEGEPPVEDPPPVNESADVRPILECVADNGDGTYTAFFGYENRHGEPVTIPYGANNRMTPTTYQGQQPEAFPMPNVVPGRPGRTPWYPGHAFTVTFSGGEQVVWRLRNRTSTASDNPAQRCPE